MEGRKDGKVNGWMEELTHQLLIVLDGAVTCNDRKNDS